MDAELDAAISEAFARNKGGFVTGFFAVVEGVDADGDHLLEWFHSDGVKTWHIRGWLHEALATQLVGQTVEMLEGEE